MTGFPLRRAILAGVLASTAVLPMIAPMPAYAQFGGIVYDPTNYAQNVLTAARSLQQINNQIQSLQNEATMLINQGKNLTRIDFPQLQAITQNIQQIDRLMGQAQAIKFQVSGLDQKFSQLFPSDFGQALRTNQQVIGARTRLDASMDAYRHTMTVQAQVAENVSADAQTLAECAARVVKVVEDKGEGRKLDGAPGGRVFETELERGLVVSPQIDLTWVAQDGASGCSPRRHLLLLVTWLGCPLKASQGRARESLASSLKGVGAAAVAGQKPDAASCANQGLAKVAVDHVDGGVVRHVARDGRDGIGAPLERGHLLPDEFVLHMPEAACPKVHLRGVQREQV